MDLRNCDCMDLMKEFPDKYFELAIVDPPYGIGECASRNNTGSRPTTKWKNPTGKIYKPFNDSIPYQEYQYKELCRVSKNQIIFGANNFNFLPPSTGWIVWDKGVSEKEHLSMCELAYSSFDIRCKKFSYLWAGFKREGNNKHKEIRTNHPTQKPVALYRWLLQNYAKKGDKILDTHLGSMSSVIACYDEKFDITGAELDPDYFKAGMERVNKHTSQVRLDDLI
jgi:site-specific DNA-methyltransferase (adenine-specific)